MSEQGKGISHGVGQTSDEAPTIIAADPSFVPLAHIAGKDKPGDAAPEMLAGGAQGRFTVLVKDWGTFQWAGIRLSRDEARELRDLLDDFLEEKAS